MAEGFLKKLKKKNVAGEQRKCPVYKTFVIDVVRPRQEILDAESKRIMTKRRGTRDPEFSREKWAPEFVKNRFRGWSGLTPEIFFGYLEMPYDRKDPEVAAVFDANNGEWPYSAQDAEFILLECYDEAVTVPVNQFMDDWGREMRDEIAREDSKSA